MIINKLKVLEEHWELRLTTPGPGKEGWMAARRERIGRMGNHYANEASLNHTVAAIICWEKPGSLGSLAASTEGTYFWARTLLPPHPLFFFLSPYFGVSYLSLFHLKCLFLVDRHSRVNFQDQSSQLGTKHTKPQC